MGKYQGAGLQGGYQVKKLNVFNFNIQVCMLGQQLLKSGDKSSDVISKVAGACEIT